MRRHLNRPGAIIAIGLSAWPFLTYSLVNFTGVGGCVRANGLRGFLAQHVALLSEVNACPAGSIGMAPHLKATLGFLLISALATVLVQTLIGVMGSELAGVIHAFAEYVARLVAPAIRLGFVPGAYPRVLSAARDLPAGRQRSEGVRACRGPPPLRVA